MTLLFDMSEAFDDLLENVNLIKRTGSYDANGRWQQDATVPTNILAVVEPDISRTLDNQSYGSQIIGNKSFWSTSEINPVNDDNGFPGDLIEYEGNTYKVITVIIWDKYGYYEANGELLSGGRQGG